jgi:hypothetical protein
VNPPRTAIKHLISAGLMLSLFAFATTPARADSDGYYCVGRGYLAYQFNGLSTTTEGHTLYLLQFDPEMGFFGPSSFALEPFQVHGMRCLDDAVDLLAWDRIYRIDRDGQEQPRIDQVEPQPEDAIFPDFTSDNLGNWALASQTIPLKTASGRFSFELVIEQHTDPKSNRSPGVIRHQTRSYLRQKDAKGTVLEQEIFSGNREETVD